MIGSPENDAALRLECWKIAVTMAGNARHDDVVVAKMASSAYNFIAGGEQSPPSRGRDKPQKAPKD